MADSIYYGTVQGNMVVLPDDVHLREGERVEVHLLDPPAAPAASPAPDDILQRRLFERGLLREIKGPVPVPPPGDRTPVIVLGQPLSEQIIEERR